MARTEAQRLYDARNLERKRSQRSPGLAMARRFETDRACTVCGREFPVTRVARRFCSRPCKDRAAAAHRIRSSETGRRYRRANKEVIAGKQAAYRLRNAERIQARMRAYNARPEVLARQRIWRGSRPDAKRATNRAWRAKNGARYRAENRERLNRYNRAYLRTRRRTSLREVFGGVPRG